MSAYARIGFKLFIMINKVYIHPKADVNSKNIGEGTRIWQFAVILENAQIGTNCNICANTFIENDVIIGNYVTIKCGVQLWDGVILEDNVFIGPNVTFTNDYIPRSKNPKFTPMTVKIKRGASIGANSTLIAGITIGEYSFIGAGSVVTHDVPAKTVWYGNPARLMGTITEDGIISYSNKNI